MIWKAALDARYYPTASHNPTPIINEPAIRFITRTLEFFIKIERSVTPPEA
jgi:hypothetical protein